MVEVTDDFLVAVGWGMDGYIMWVSKSIKPNAG